MAKAESKSKHWKREAKAGAEKIKWAEKERDKAKQKAKVARLTAATVGDAKARVEDDPTRARDGLATTEKDGRRLDVEVTCQAIEWTSLFLEL